MRTLKSIMVLGLALSTFTATEAAKLTFKVTNPNEKVKVILTFNQSGEQKEVAIDAAGNVLFIWIPIKTLPCHSTVTTCGETPPLKEQVPLSTPIWEAKSSNHSVCPI